MSINSDKLISEVSNILNDVVNDVIYLNKFVYIKNKIIDFNHEFQGVSPNEKYGLSFSNYDFNEDYYDDINIGSQNFIIWNLSNNEPLQCNHEDIDHFFSMNCFNYLFSNNDKYLCIRLKNSINCKTIIIDLNNNKVINVDIDYDVMIEDTNLDILMFSNDERYLFKLYSMIYIDGYDYDYGNYQDINVNRRFTYEGYFMTYEDQKKNTPQFVKVFDILRGIYIIEETFCSYYSYLESYHDDEVYVHSACFNDDNSILILLHLGHQISFINLYNGKKYLCRPIDDQDVGLFKISSLRGKQLDYQDLDLFKISSLVIRGKQLISNNDNLICTRCFFDMYTMSYYLNKKKDKYQLFIGNLKGTDIKYYFILLKIIYFYDVIHKGKNRIPTNSVDKVFQNKNLIQHISEWIWL